jgi:hypothetical protein
LKVSDAQMAVWEDAFFQVPFFEESSTVRRYQ